MADSTTVPPYPQTPVLETVPAFVAAIVNFVPGLGGIGTLIAGIVGHQRLIGRAAAQFFLQIIIVGYIWSIVTGAQLLINWSWGTKNQAPEAAAAEATPAAPKKAPAKSAPAAKAPAKKAAKKSAK